MRALATISNIFAWLLVIAGALIAAGCPLALPVYAKMEAIPTSWTYIAILSAVGLVTAVGGLLVLKRRPIGVWLSLTPGIAWISTGQVLPGVVYLVVAFSFLGFPVFLYKALSQEKSVEPRVA